MKTTTMKTESLEGAALDWAVAQAVGEPVEINEFYQLEQTDRFLCCGGVGHPIWEPSECWSQGGRLIERNRVRIVYSDDDITPYAVTRERHPALQAGDTVLVAAMRAIVASKLGDTVDVPEALAHD